MAGRIAKIGKLLVSGVSLPSVTYFLNWKSFANIVPCYRVDNVIIVKPVLTTALKNNYKIRRGEMVSNLTSYIDIHSL